MREGFRRNAIDAAHFLGLAHLYAEKGENARAIECLEVAKAKDLANPSNHKLHGRLLFRRRDFDGAAEEFGRALRYNPFDRETAESLGRAEYERKRFEAALGATVHAFLLLNDGDDEGVRRLRRRIQTLKQILGWGNRELSARSSASARSWCTPPSTGWSGTASASWSRAGCRRPTLLDHRAAAEAAGPGRPARAGLPAAADEAAGPLLRRADLPAHPGGARGAPRRGQPDLRPPHPGARPLRAGAGRDHGPAHHLLRHLRARHGRSRGTSSARRASSPARSGAPTPSPPRRARSSASTPQALDSLLEGSPELGVQIYWTLWHSLARKLRATNEQLKTFFSAESMPENFLRLRKQPAGAGLVGDGGALGQDPPVPRAGALAPGADDPRHLLQGEALHAPAPRCSRRGTRARRCTSSWRAG